MLKKYGSIYIIIAMVVVTIAAFAFGTYRSTQASIRTFYQDGFTLRQSGEASLDGVVEPSQVWFGSGVSWTAKGSTISFTDAQGNATTINEDAFLHYNGGTIATLAKTAVLDLDSYAMGIIRQYSMQRGESLNNLGGEFQLGAEGSEIVMTNLLLKNSELKYLAASPQMKLQIPNRTAIMLGEGFAELTYQAEDKSVVMLQDTSSEYTFVTKDATLVLQNGVVIHLDTGKMEPYANAEEQAATGTYLGFDDLDLSLITTTAAQAESVSQYSTFRFHVSDGEDGKEGEKGTDANPGDDGNPGLEGDPGTDGGAGGNGAAGATGAAGANNGVIASEGFPGDTVPSVNLLTRLPVVRITKWKVSGAGLYFTLAMDESSYEVITSGSTLIQLFDLTTGERVQWWDSGQNDQDAAYVDQQIDLSEDSEEGYTLFTNALQAGHQYRLSVSVGYELEEISGTQEVLTRTFTADDYGVSITQTAVDETSATFQIQQINKNGNANAGYLLSRVRYSLDGGISWSNYETDFDNFVVMPDNPKTGTTYDVIFECELFENIVDEEGAVVRSEQPETIYYNYSFTTLKKEPKVGGVRLTPYGSGHFMAEILGEYSIEKGIYEDVVDEDDAIVEVLFELSDQPDFSNIVATERVTSNYSAFFKITNDSTAPVHTGITYYLRAQYTKDNTSTVTVLPVLETCHNTELGLVKGERATDEAKLDSITEMNLRFEGNQEMWNLVSEVGDEELCGITYNQISGNIVAQLKNSNYYISKAHPVELHISALPGYYQSKTFTMMEAVVEEGQTTYVLKNPVEQNADIQELEETICIPIDLDGLKAETSYMITMYGYEKRDPDSDVYNRVVMGAMSIETREYIGDDENSYLTFRLEPDTNGASVGCYPVFGKQQSDGTDAPNSYQNGQYSDDFASENDAVYRGLAYIKFELYLLGTGDTPDERLGSCVIRDDDATADKSLLYELFYGENAAATYEENKFIVGVGEDYMYQFKDDSGRVLLPEGLNNGRYEIRATEVYDYTYTRYQLSMDGTTTEYNYYTYRGEEEEYVNKLNTDIQTIPAVEIKTVPYKEPGKSTWYENGIYIKTETLTNEEVAEYIFNEEAKETMSLYTDATGEKLAADTVVGIKLNSLYRNDNNLPRTTRTFTYYGYIKEQYEQIARDVNPVTGQNYTTGEWTSSKYKFSFSIRDFDQYVNVPEVWIVSIPNSGINMNDFRENLAGEVLAENTTEAWASADYNRCCQRITVNNQPVYVFYIMNTYNGKTVFDRGLTYRFAYEASLGDYPQEGQTFSYPKDFYKLKGVDYTVENLLKSSYVEMRRQTPVVYSALKNTTLESVQTDSQEGTTYAGKDAWNIYVEDPDNAIRWKTLLTFTDDKQSTTNSGNVLPDDSKYQMQKKGGLSSLLTGTEIIKNYGAQNNLNLEVYFGTRTSANKRVAITASTTYDKAKLGVGDCLNDEDLDEIGRWLTRTSNNSYGNTVTVNNLNLNGMDYNLAVDYLVLDDSDDNLWSSVNLMGHNYIGHHEASQYESMNYYIEGDKGDGNTINIYLEDVNAQGSPIADVYWGEAYLSKVRSIAAIELTAYNVTKSSDILERDPETGGTIASHKKVLYLEPKAPVAGAGGTYSDYRYYADFKISDLDQLTGKEGEAALQYDPGDILTFKIKVHYASGESQNILADAYSQKNFTLKYVNGIETDINLYNSGENVTRPVFMHMDGNSRIPWGTAARSLYDLKGSPADTTTIPWRQELTMTSRIFDTAYYANGVKVSSVELSSKGGYASGSVQVLEVLKAGTAASDKISIKYRYPEGEQQITGVKVKSAIPAFESVSETKGLSSVVIESKVSNYNLVDYPGDEELAFYYLVYEYEVNANGTMKDDTVRLYGFMKDDSAKTGTVKLRFPLEVNTHYLIVPYYKSQEKGGANFETLTDAVLFEGVGVDGAFPKNGVFYEGNLAEFAEEKIKENPVFQTVVQLDRPSYQSIPVYTTSGIIIGSVDMTLGQTNSYAEKQLEITASISSDIMEDEKAGLKLFYFIERCPEDEIPAIQTNWETVIAQDDFIAVTEGLDITWKNDETPAAGTSSYWSYYGDDITYYNQYVTKGNNRMTMPYYSGGQIVPGYYYRARVAVGQTTDGNVWTNVGVLGDGSTTQGTYSAEILWSSVDPMDGYAYVATQTASRTYDYIRIPGSVQDPNNTMLTESFYVRLAEKQTDGTWKILENPNTDAGIYMDGMDEEYAIYNSTGGTQSYNFRFQNLKSETTYRLQFYALTDSDYDNQLNFTVDGSNRLMEQSGKAAEDSALDTQMLKTEDYYPAPSKETVMESNLAALQTQFMTNQTIEDYLSFASVDLGNNTKGSLLIGYSNEVTTLPSTTTAYAGDIPGNIRVDSNSELTLNFKDAFNAANISMITFDIVPSAKLDVEKTWSATTIYRTGESMFVSEDGESIGNEGNISLTLDLTGQEESVDGKNTKVNAIDISKAGRYALTIHFYIFKDGVYQRVQTLNKDFIRS